MHCLQHFVPYLFKLANTLWCRIIINHAHRSREHGHPCVAKGIHTRKSWAKWAHHMMHRPDAHRIGAQAEDHRNRDTSCSVGQVYLQWLMAGVLRAVGGLALAVEGPSKAEIHCVDNKDGTCSVSYLPTVAGEYSIIIKFADQHIAGSPFTAHITSPCNFFSLCFFSWQFLLNAGIFIGFSVVWGAWEL